MATTPEEEVPEQPLRERVARAVGAPMQTRNRPVILMALAAGLASLAPLPAGPISAAILVAVAFDRGKR